MADDFEYVSRARLEYRHAYLGEVPEPVAYGVQGALRAYYDAKEGPPVPVEHDGRMRHPDAPVHGGV